MGFVPCVPDIGMSYGECSVDEGEMCVVIGEHHEYLAVECKECTIEEHKKWSKKDGRGAVYHKCHCKVLLRQKFNKSSRQWECVLRGETRGLSRGERIHVEYMCGERDSEWIRDPKRVFGNKDEFWCAHGRFCNRWMRYNACTKHNHAEVPCKFCHDPLCAEAIRSLS